MGILKHLLIQESYDKRPIYTALKCENWNLKIDSINVIKYQTKWTAKLEFNASAWIDKTDNTPDHLIKDQLIKNIHWQIYGDVKRMLNYLTETINNDDKEYALKIINEIRMEIE